jgi:DNA-binding MarR family transcriptional regulator
MSIFRKIASAARNRTTYAAGLLQAKAYRILKQRTTELLAPAGISTIEWAFLGLLIDNDSLRAQEAAYELGVEAPFVTVMAANLSKKGFVSIAKDADDSRAKNISLTATGKRFVAKTETELRAGMRGLVSGASPNDLLGYLAVLECIVENGQKKKKTTRK